MRSDKLQDAIGEIRDDYIQDANITPARPRSHLKRGILAASIGIVAACVCAAAVLTMTRLPTHDSTTPPAISEAPHDSTLSPAASEAPQTLVEYFAQQGVKAEALPEPISVTIEEPMMQKEDLLRSIRSSLTVQGTITAMESVRIPGSNVTRYITTAEVRIEEVLSGETDAKTLSLVYRLDVYDEKNGLPESFSCIGEQLVGCREGTNAVFLLQEQAQDPLGAYSITRRLERTGDDLTYGGYVTVSLQELQSP